MYRMENRREDDTGDGVFAPIHREGGERAEVPAHGLAGQQRHPGRRLIYELGAQPGRPVQEHGWKRSHYERIEPATTESEHG